MGSSETNKVNMEKQETSSRCPTCNSPKPQLHPAVQFEGEVQICKDAWHTSPRTVLNKMISRIERDVAEFNAAGEWFSALPFERQQQEIGIWGDAQIAYRNRNSRGLADLLNENR